MNTTAADLPFPTNITAVPENESTSNLPLNVKDPVAGVRLEGTDLVFAWAEQQPDPKITAQLMNCLVEISDGQNKRVAQLREPTKAPPLALDLMAEIPSVETQLVNPPRANSLRLEVTDLIGFASGVKFRGDVRSTSAVSAVPQSAGALGSGIRPALPPGPMPGVGMPGVGMPGLGGLPRSGQLTIELEGIAGLEIRIGFKEESGKVIITTDASYSDDGQEGDLSPRRITLVEEEAKRQLPLAQRELDVAERTLRTASERLKKLKDDEPIRTSRRFPAWNAEHMKVTTTVASGEKNVAALTARVEKLKTQLDGVQKLRAWLKDSGQAAIHYVVYGECGDTDLLLIDGRASR
jgi:hypothetical protein